jgi:hypothetical protein
MPRLPKARERAARRANAPPPPTTAEPLAAPAPREAGGNQETLRSLGIQAKLTVSQPGDPDEQEADRAADAFVNGRAAPSIGARAGGAIQRQCSGCKDDAPIARKAGAGAGAAAPRLAGAGAAIGASHGEALSPHLQRDFGSFFNTDLSQVRLHTGAPAHTAADALAAQAFTRGGDIYFGRGRFDPRTGGGKHLLAHELAHTVQQSGGADAGQRLQRAATCTVSGPPQANAGTDAVTKAVRDGDVDVVVTSMRGMGVPELCALRGAVVGISGQKLERWLMSHRSRADALGTAARLLPVAAALAAPAIGPGLATLATLLPGGTAGKKSGATAEEGLRLILPVLPLIDKLEMYDEGYREIEQAQLDIIRNAAEDERRAASAESARLEAIYAHMDVKEEYDARLLIDPEKKYAAAEHLLTRAPGVVSDDEDLVFDAIWALAPSERKGFYNKHNMDLHHLLSADRFKLLGTLSTGTEAEALIARLRLATESRIDDKEAIQAVVDRAVALLAEQKGLRATLAVTTLPPEELDKAKARLAELGELEALVKFGKGKLDPASFLGRLADAADSPDAFGAMAHKLGTAVADPQERTEFAFAAAKQRIMMAASVGGADEDAVRNAILELRAPPIDDAVKLTPPQRDQKQAEANAKLRQRLVDDDDVKRVINGMVGTQRRRVLSFISADPFVEKLTDLTLALNSARWGEFFQLVLQIALRDDWRKRFEDTSSSPFDTYARVHGKQRDIMLEILKSKRIPTEQILGFTGDVETLRAALSSMDETERTQLRLGYLLSRTGRQPADDKAKDALAAFRKFDANLRKSQTTLGAVDTAGIEAVLDAALGSEPTEQEMATDEGKYNAAALMYERIQARLALGRGASALFTETDETMLAAGREFAALWLQLRERKPPKLTTIELGTLAAFYDQFNHRSEEFTEASNTAGEVAGMVAATIAGTLIVIGTGGITAPAVIAAAAAGGGARVVSREMFGADYYNPVGAAGTRDAVLGGIDAALAVVGASLGAKGAELVGLGGKAFLTNAAKIGGQVAEQASGKLLHRVAAGAVEAAIDGAFSGFVSEAANAMTDSRTWRRGVWSGLVSVGHSALAAGLAGLAGGAVIGGALPVLGRGAKLALEGAAALRVEAALERAGVGKTLASARQAATAGDVKTLDRLFAELEGHLTGEQAGLLRKRLYSDLEGSLSHPYGRAELESPEQTRLLAQTAALEGDGLSAAQREAELGIVGRSEPQPSTVDGYVDEVNLGNRHTWRRRDDGTWCRFSKPSLCGTSIPGAKPFRGRARTGTPPPHGYKTIQVDMATLPRDRAGNLAPLKEGVIYEFPGGHRVWREGDLIRHDSVLGRSTGRKGTELDMFAAKESGMPEIAGMQRAHTLGQGTGFESPFGIFYAPAEVNQIIQNNGVEELLRGFRDKALNGEAFHVSTLTSAHPGGLRLKEIRYRVEVARGGKKDFLFEYVISVGNDVPNPTITHGVANVTENPNVAQYFDLVDVPARLRSRFRGFKR